jgi:hypothetical protein
MIQLPKQDCYQVFLKGYRSFTLFQPLLRSRCMLTQIGR